MSKRYRQKGYMDDDRPERPRSPKGPRPERDGPRGRGLGRPTRATFQCARCGEERDPDETIAVDSACASCGDPLHSCVNCRHFDTAARWECRLEISERIAGKRKGNECTLFEPKTVQVFAPEAPAPSAGRSAFDALFD